MTHKPLMLSDTAMVLLRQYDEFIEHYWAVRYLIYSPTMSEEQKKHWREWNKLHNHRQLLDQLQRGLLQEIWLLWRYPDLPPVRHLDWHLVLPEGFVAWGEKTNVMALYTYSLADFAQALIEIPSDLAQFLKKLLAIYREAVVVRTAARPGSPMTCAPLMLSDTAMVLLRECVALDDEALAFRAQLNASSWNDTDASRRWAEWNAHENWLHLRNLQFELIHEIWLLWTFRDIPIVRHLDWHLVLDDALTAEVEATFLLSSPEPDITNLLLNTTRFTSKFIRYYRDTRRTLDSIKTISDEAQS